MCLSSSVYHFNVYGNYNLVARIEENIFKAMNRIAGASGRLLTTGANGDWSTTGQYNSIGLKRSFE